MPGRGSRATPVGLAVSRSTMRARNHQCSSASESPKSAPVSEPSASSARRTPCGSGAAVNTTGMSSCRATRAAASVPTSAIRRWIDVDAPARAQHPPQAALDLDPVRPRTAHVDAAGRPEGDRRDRSPPPTTRPVPCSASAGRPRPIVTTSSMSSGSRSSAESSPSSVATPPLSPAPPPGTAARSAWRNSWATRSPDRRDGGRRRARGPVHEGEDGGSTASSSSPTLRRRARRCRPDARRGRRWRLRRAPAPSS